MTLLNDLWKELNDSAFLRARKGTTAYDEIRGIYSHYRNQLRRARPFIISDRALETAYELSLQEPKRIAARLPLARLPFDTIWLEFDFLTKLKLAQKRGTGRGIDAGSPERIGWLLERDPIVEDRWSAVCFTTIPPEVFEQELDPHQYPGVSFYSLLILMDLQNREPPLQMGRYAGAKLHLRNEFPGSEYDQTYWKEYRQHLWGWFSPTDNPQIVNIGRPPDKLYNAVNVGVEPLNEMFMSDMSDREKLKTLNSAAQEARGDARLLITLLSLINEVPIEYTNTKPQGTFRARGNFEKFLSYSTVNIMIPARRPVRFVDRILRHAEESYKKRHEVRGHWRTIKHKRDHIRKVKKPDGTVEEITFLKGELERVWVKEHERGDASLGWVEHHYEVDKSRR